MNFLNGEWYLDALQTIEFKG